MEKIRVIYRTILYAIYKLIGKRFVISEVLGNKMVLDLKNGGVSGTLFVHGERELLETEVVLNELREDMNILELGANIGYYAIKEASLLTTGKIFAFEPDPRNVEVLEKNVELNGFQDKMKIYPFAAGDEDTTKEFGLSQKTNLSGFVDNKKVDSISVKCVKLDNFSDLKNEKINLIRMDIEGYECMVIDGMKELLERSNDIKIMMEVHPTVYDEGKFNFNDRLRLLEKMGFRVKYLVSAGEKLPEEITSKYNIEKSIREGRFYRGLFKEVSFDDLIDFLGSKSKIVRAILLEKKND